MEMLGRIRRMFYRDGLSRSEIARRTGLSRNTIKKWLVAPQAAAPKYRRRGPTGKLAAFEATLRQALEVDAHRPKRDRRTALALHAELKAVGYGGGYTAVTDFIRRWHQDAGAHAPTRAFVLVAYPSQGHEMLFDAHTRSFLALGGIPRRGIYDNMKTAVDKVKKGKGRVVNARFSALCSHYLFEADFCNVASGWEKGVVEKNVQDSRRRIWQEAGKHRFGSFAELNAWLLGRCRVLWQEVRHPEYRELTVAEMLEHEAPHLMPMVTPFDGYVEEAGRVSSTCLVSIARNHYSVPCELAGKLISKRLYPERVEVVHGDTVVASHPRLFERGQTRYDWQHYIGLAERKPGVLRNGAPFGDLPEALRRLQRLLLQREGGDRVMSQVLAAVPRAGLEAVVVAVDLVLESGLVSAEHILNVLGRLNSALPPGPVATLLQVKEAPLADTGRYDRLRRKETDHA